MNLTLKSVAQELGVSTATISNAFNKPDQLSVKRREEILAKCEELGYSGPNKAARSLRRGKTGIIAVVLVDSIQYVVSDAIASTFVKGASRVFEEQQQQLLLVSGSSYDLSSVNDFVDGYLCYGSPTNGNLVNALKNSTKPVVTVDFNLGNFPSLNIDNSAATQVVAQQTLKKGDRIAVIGLRLIDSPVTCRVYDTKMYEPEISITRRRLQGYETAFAAADVIFDYDHLWSIPENIETHAMRAAKEVLTISPRPNIVYCMSDLIALYFIRAARDQGLRVPEDIRVVGFDGTKEGQRYQPNLTTVLQNSEEKGVKSAELLLSGSAESIILPHDVIFGESCPKAS